MEDNGVVRSFKVAGGRRIVRLEAAAMTVAKHAASEAKRKAGPKEAKPVTVEREFRRGKV